ncbi:MAG: ABC transporter ATP-binding protein [Oscillospiraceae bacterium]|nr:ABC transporter ATP-binding protein [Oscillospiraceae bacterium]MDD6083998.1 ABC transporter ATP-binding protein [Oscillospiraceae bacterium]
MKEEIIISAENLVKKYGKGEDEVIALNDVSMKIRKGEFISVTGESGSGKSTLLNVLGSLDKPDSGKIMVGDKDLVTMKDNDLAAYRRRKTGFIFQTYNLIPVLNVVENIVLPLNLDNAKTDKDYLEELLELSGLSDKRNRFPHELSGGQQQRVAFVRALIHKPEIIFADEPTGNLDNKTSRDIIAILKNSVRKYNQALVLITHDLSVASQADTIYVMNDGVLSQGGGQP